jgi:RNA polymerase sigma factor (sigma-70 family)
MMTQITQPTDSDLLARYMQAGDERAFAELVRVHERLVIGTATRITGNAESARDVAQQVFATLAQKAWMLTDRTSLAGWLHHAARHVALRTARSETARNRRHEQLAVENMDTAENDVWPLLEEALATLPESEREAVVMHHLQDRSYAEMASALGLTEAAVRKRVSRGVQNLGAQLRKRGVRASALSLLAGATALQVGTSSVAVAATVATAAPFSLTLTTLMAHSSIKLAAVLALAAAVPLAWQTHAKSALRDELAALQQQPRPALPLQPSAVTSTVGGVTSALRAENRDLNVGLAAARQAHSDAASALAKTRATVSQLANEVVISHGTVDELARSFVKQMLPMVEGMKSMKGLEGKEREARELELTSQLVGPMIQLRPLVKAMCKLEDRPEDVARVNAIIYQDVLGLDANLRQRLEGQLLADYQQLKTDGLTASLRPKENLEAWTARRQAVSYAMEQNLRALLPKELLDHPIFETNEGLLMDLTDDEIKYLDVDAKATPSPAPTKP